MKLGKYFTLNELSDTNTGLINNPNKDEIENLKLLVEKVLDPARELLGKPITVTSGYRSPLVNRKVNGSKTSQHIKGEAADIKCEDNNKLFNIIKDNFEFDQLIWEYGDNNQPAWVHVSFKKDRNRNQILKYDGKKYVNMK